MSVLAAESRKQECTIVGEDLGTVPPGFRERMARARIFSCRLLYFERENGAFRDPAAYPKDSVASTGTHDLPPLLGFWDDLSEGDRSLLCNALACRPNPDALELETAAYRTLGRAASRMVLLQMEDAMLGREPVNVPGTTSEQPNWRRKLPAGLEELQADAAFATISAALRASRAGKEHP